MNRGCSGRMSSVISERALQMQSKYFVFLWDMDHVCQQIADSNLYGTKQDIVRMIDDTDRKIVFTYVKGPEKNCRSVPTIGFHPPSGRMCLVAFQPSSVITIGVSKQRTRHPDEIKRSGGILKPDVEWYLTQQILPSVSRLCEPIDGLSQGQIAQRLGLEFQIQSAQLFRSLSTVVFV
jgi:hypothetical protein